MNERCGVPHPEYGGPCTCNYVHEQHQAWHDGAWRYWPNDAYRPPPPPSNTKGNLQTIKDMSRRSMAAKMPVNRVVKTPDEINVALPSDPHGTSVIAAWLVAPRTGTARRKVLEAIKQQPRTDDELVACTGLRPNTCRPRRNELMVGGFIEPDPDLTGVSAVGNPAIVWRVTEKGRLA